MAEEAIQDEPVEVKEVNSRAFIEGEDNGYIKPDECGTHCDQIPYAWQEELEINLNTAGGHIQYGIGNSDDEFCSAQDLIDWIESRRDSDKLCAFPQEQDCISQIDRDAGKVLSDENQFKGFTLLEWKGIPESESPWEVTYDGGQDEWKEKYSKVYGFEPEEEVIKNWPEGLAMDAEQHEKEQVEWAIKDGVTIVDEDGNLNDPNADDYIPPVPNFETMSKDELEQYGRGIGIELDKRHDEAELINIIYDHEHPVEEVEEVEEAPTEE